MRYSPLGSPTASITAIDLSELTTNRQSRVPGERDIADLSVATLRVGEITIRVWGKTGGDNWQNQARSGERTCGFQRNHPHIAFTAVDAYGVT